MGYTEKNTWIGLDLDLNGEETFQTEVLENNTFSIDIAAGEVLLSENYNTEVNWIADYHLYHILTGLENANIAIPISLASFTTSVDSDIASIGGLNSAILSATAEPSSFTNHSENIITLINQIINEHETMSAVDYESIVGSLSTLNEQLQENNQSSFSAIQSGLLDVDLSVPYNSTHPTANLYAEAYGEAIKVLMDESNDVSRLYTIANKCPIEGGEAIYLARGILKLMGDNTVYDNTLLCNRAPRSPLASEEAEPKNTLIISPNPTNGYVHIPQSDLIENVQITSIDGIQNESIIHENGRIDMSSFRSGVYIVKVRYEDNSEHFGKIILVK